MDTHTQNPPSRIPRSPGEAQKFATASCEAWNRLYCVGTKVRVYCILGDEKTALDTTTTSEAWVMGGHSAMVLVAGLSGGYALTHVKPYIGSATSLEGESAGVFCLNQDVAATIATHLESEVEA